MAYRGVRGLVRDPLVLLVVLVAALSGCTYDRQERGLFPPVTPTPAPTAPTRQSTTLGSLPVAGDAVWTSGDGLDVTVRWAVHAVRRVPAATVLDWSVTPLSGPGLAVGDAVPAGLDLGLTHRGDRYDNVFLLDLGRGRVYRPLTRRGDPEHTCLCTPTSGLADRLQVGQTTLLQTVYPPLPTSVIAIDVDISTVPPFEQIPVSPAGRLPRGGNAVDLTRPAARSPAVATTQEFTYRPGHQRFTVSIDSFEVGARFAAVRWSIESVTSGLGLEVAERPPFGDERPPAGLANRVAAAGPQAVVTDRGQPPLRNRLGTRNRVRIATAKLDGRRALDCLCTDLRGSTSRLTRAGERIGVVTVLPALEIGYSGIDIVIPRVQTLQDVGTSASPRSTLGTGQRRYAVETRSHPYGLPSAFRPADWPTPVPSRDELSVYAATVDRVVR